MGALLFMVLMFGLLCIGGFFLLLGLAFLLARRRGKKKDTPKKTHTALTGVFLTLGAVICILPIGYWLFLRAANSFVGKGYVNTGKFVDGGYQSGAFTVDGATYERLDLNRSALCPDGKAVFSWNNESGWDRFFGYHDRGNYLAVENTPGLELIRDAVCSLWCRSDQLDQAQAWYGDYANYDWYLYDYDHADGEGNYTLLDPQPDQKFISALQNFAENRAGPKEFVFTRDAQVEDHALVSISTDRVVERDRVYLAVYDRQLCLMGTKTFEGNTRTDTAYPLPADLDSYFSQFLR